MERPVTPSWKVCRTYGICCLQIYIYTRILAYSKMQVTNSLFLFFHNPEDDQVSIVYLNCHRHINYFLLVGNEVVFPFNRQCLDLSNQQSPYVSKVPTVVLSGLLLWRYWLWFSVMPISTKVDSKWRIPPNTIETLLGYQYSRSIIIQPDSSSSSSLYLDSVFPTSLLTCTKPPLGKTVVNMTLRSVQLRD